MQFVHPYFLLGLLAVAIPVLIHLFNLKRYKKVLFSNVRFLKLIQQETKKQSQLRHLLVLIARILAIACLVIAFAQPYIPLSETSADFQSGNAISIYVDNSFSMQALSNAGSLLDEAKSKAAEIAMAFNQSDEFNLITNDFDASRNRFLTRQDFFDELDKVSYSPRVRLISGILRKQYDIFEKASLKNKKSFLLSDFQKGLLDVGDIRTDSTFDHFVIPLYAQKRDNIYVDSCWFSTPAVQVNDPVTLKVLIRNVSETNLEKIPVKLIIDGTQRALASFDVEGDSETIVSLQFTLYSPGVKKGKVEIADYPVVYDDDLFFTFKVNPYVSVYRICSDESTAFLKMLYEGDSLFRYNNVDNQRIDYSEMQSYDLVILDQIVKISSGLERELERLLTNNTNVVIIPPEQPDMQSYNSFLGRMGNIDIQGKDTLNLDVEWLNLQDPLFYDVFEELPEFEGNTKIDLPFVRKHFLLNIPVRSNAEVLMRLSNDDPFLVKIPNPNGQLFVFASPLNQDWTNFFQHALFVPVFYKLSLLSSNVVNNYYIIGKDDVIFPSFPLPANDDIIHVKNLTDGLDYIPEYGNVQRNQYLKFYDVVTHAGQYDVTANGNFLGSISFNYDRRESILKFASENELETFFEIKGDEFVILSDTSKPLAQTISELSEGRRLWKIFIIFALAFLLSEVLMLRFWK